MGLRVGPLPAPVPSPGELPVPAPRPGKPDRLIVGVLAATLLLYLLGRSIGLGRTGIERD